MRAVTTNASPGADAAVERNRRAYRRRFRSYEQRHGEIFNPVEQTRLHDALQRAVGHVRSGSEPKRALDFGCGTGNLTEHLLGLGCEVLAADVSREFLQFVETRFAGRPVRTHELNGRDLAGVPDASLDVVATYSVLHHIPDYLAALGEMARVLKPGGVIFVDHEASNAVWEDGQALAAFYAEADASRAPRLRLLRPSYLAGLARHLHVQVRRRSDPRYEPEGDIHVWPDDHIEWPRVDAALEAAGCEIVLAEDYLMFRRDYDRGVWEQARRRLNDAHVHVARKR